jgi:hypothetical protein
MDRPWKEIVLRGICHYPDVASDNVYIVLVDEFDDPRWLDQADRYRGKTWYVVVFPIELERSDEPSVHSFRCGSLDPSPTLKDAIRRAEDLVPTGISWQIG